MDVLGRLEVDDPLRNVDGVVADALEEARDEEELCCPFLTRPLLRDEIRECVERVLEDVIHLLVQLADLVGLLDALVAIRLDGAAQHRRSTVAELLAQLLDPFLMI